MRASSVMPFHLNIKPLQSGIRKVFNKKGRYFLRLFRIGCLHVFSMRLVFMYRLEQTDNYLFFNNINYECKTCFFLYLILLYSFASFNAYTIQLFLLLKGNDIIHLISQNGRHKIRIKLEPQTGGKYIADYSTFRVGDEKSKYLLNITGYTGTAGKLFYDNISNSLLTDWFTQLKFFVYAFFVYCHWFFHVFCVCYEWGFFCSYSRVANYKQAFVFLIVNESMRISKMCNTNNSVLFSSAKYKSSGFVSFDELYDVNH